MFSKVSQLFSAELAISLEDCPNGLHVQLKVLTKQYSRCVSRDVSFKSSQVLSTVPLC